MYEVDVPNQVCAKYKIVDYERLLFQHEADLPIAQCNGVFGFTTEDTPKVIDWGRDRIQDAKEKCK